MAGWRLLNHVNLMADPAVNLAIDEAILNAAAMGIIPPTLRFWRNDKAVVIGRSQSVVEEVDLKICRREGVRVLRRISGGGAVYQDFGNINYTIVLRSELLGSPSILESYSIFCSGLVRALRMMGLSVELKVPGNILVNGKKVSGSAQFRRKGAILHHGTLLVSSDLNLLKNVLKAWRDGYRGRYVKSVRMPVSNLRDELGSEIDLNELIDLLGWCFERELSMKLMPGELHPVERAVAEKLYNEKYSRRSWNYSR